MLGPYTTGIPCQYAEGVVARWNVAVYHPVRGGDRRPIRIIPFQGVAVAHPLRVGQGDPGEGEGEVILVVWQLQVYGQAASPQTVAPRCPIGLLVKESQIGEVDVRFAGIAQHLARIVACSTAQGAEPQCAVRVQHARIPEGLQPDEAFVRAVVFHGKDMLLQNVQFQEVDAAPGADPYVLIRVQQHLLDGVGTQPGVRREAVEAVAIQPEQAVLLAADPQIPLTIAFQRGEDPPLQERHG